MYLGVKEFCKFCDKSFTQSHNLKQHVKKVHGEEAFLFPNNATTNITENKQCQNDESAHLSISEAFYKSKYFLLDYLCIDSVKSILVLHSCDMLACQFYKCFHIFRSSI